MFIEGLFLLAFRMFTWMRCRLAWDSCRRVFDFLREVENCDFM